MEFQLVSLLLVLLTAWVAGLIANRYGMPAILGELAAGIIFGPALLGMIVLDPSIPFIGGHRLGFPEDVPGLHVLGEVGVFLLLLYIGMEVDFRDLVKAGKAGLLAAIGGFLVPFLLGLWLAEQFDVKLAGALFLGLAMGVTSIATKSRILLDLRLFGTRVANVLLAGALISDTAVLIIFAVILGVTGPEGLQVSKLLMVTVKTIFFFLIATVVGIKLLPILGDWIPRLGLRDRTGDFTIVLLIGLLYAELAHLLGLHAIIGAFIAGLFIREGVLRGRLSHDIAILVRDLSVGFLAPIFFVIAGFSVTLGVVVERPLLVINVLILATVGKIVGTAFFYVMGRLNWREGVVVGAGMNGRGAVEIIVAQLALDMGLISRDIFSVLVLMAFFTTMTVPAFLKWGTNWLRSRGELIRSDENRRGIVFVGASPLARVLAHEFLALNERVVMIDSNRGRCEAARREGLEIITGNALNDETLIQAGGREARTLLAFTPNAEVNTVAMKNAREVLGIPEARPVIAPLAGEQPDADTPAPALDITDLNHYEKWNYLLLKRDYDRVATRVTQPATLEEFLSQFPGAEILPLLVNRKGRGLLPVDATKVEVGDEVVFLREKVVTAAESNAFDLAAASCPLLDLPTMSLDEFFQKVADIMGGRLDYDPELLKLSLLARERESSTLIIEGLAIPHAELPGKGKFDMLIARCMEGIPFHHAEGGSARMIFVLFSSRDERTQHLRALSSIAQMVQAPNFERKWLEAEDDEALRKLVLSTKI